MPLASVLNRSIGDAPGLAGALPASALSARHSVGGLRSVMSGQFLVGQPAADDRL